MPLFGLKQISKRVACPWVILFGCCATLLPLDQRAEAAQAANVATAAEPRQTLVARGTVFVDANDDGVFQAGERALGGVRVSNGKSIVTTDAAGNYEIEIDDDSIVFVIKPRGYRTAMSAENLPRFYYIHKPAGSPKLRFAGVEPTGPLPSAINFPLYPQNEPADFKAVLFGDPQPRNLKEVDYISEDIIPELIGTDATLGVTLGDIVFDDLSCFSAVNEAYSLVGIPWYNVIGNHDINFDVKNRKMANETFERIYGPSYYSFDYGNVHFVVTDNINYVVPEGAQRGSYTAKFGDEQLEFIKNDLALVPDDSLVVLMMHIPLEGTEDRQDLYRLIEQRPFCISISGHTHFHAHRFIDQADGWKGKSPHHHIINVTVSGSWWGGQADERGVPHTMMSDGAPNGYSVMKFDNTNYQLDFFPANRPASYQMNIVLPESIEQEKVSGLELVANVFNAMPMDTVEARLGVDGEWFPLENYQGLSPLYQQVREREVDSDGKPMLGGPSETQHLWKISLSQLTSTLAPGHHLVQVRWTDRDGRKTVSNRVLRVTQSVSEQPDAATESESIQD